MIHFPAPYKHARHYTGWTEGPDLAPRFQAHLTGRGSPLVYAMCKQNGIETTDQLLAHVAATWQGDRYLERKIKNYGGQAKVCPICKGGCCESQHGEDAGGHNRVA